MGTNHVVVDAAAVDVADVADATAAIAVVAVAAGLALVPVAAAKWQQYVGTCTVLVFVPAVFHPISHQQPLTGAIYSPISGKKQLFRVFSRTFEGSPYQGKNFVPNVTL